MKLCMVIFGVLVSMAISYAVENGPLLTALHPQQTQELVLVEPAPELNRQKRGLLLGAALGAGVLGAGVLGAGALIGAKAGLVGGALVGGALHSGRSYGGWGYGSGYYGGGGYYGSGYYSRGYYGGGYYGGYRSYPTYLVEEDEW